jgi:hypothetical protein
MLRLTTEWEVMFKESKEEELMNWSSFFGNEDPRTIEDRKHVKMTGMNRGDADQEVMMMMGNKRSKDLMSKGVDA